jgi:hypothetical protein
MRRLLFRKTNQAAGDRLAHDPRPQAILRRVPQI